MIIIFKGINLELFLLSVLYRQKSFTYCSFEIDFLVFRSLNLSILTSFDLHIGKDLHLTALFGIGFCTHIDFCKGLVGIFFFIFAVLDAGSCKKVSNITGLGIGTCKGFSIEIYKKSFFLTEPLACGWKSLLIHPFILLSFCPSVQTFSWDWLISFFWNWTWCFGPMYFCPWQSQVFSKKDLPQKWKTWTKMGSKCFVFIYWKI